MSGFCFFFFCLCLCKALSLRDITSSITLDGVLWVQVGRWGGVCVQYGDVCVEERQILHILLDEHEGKEPKGE